LLRQELLQYADALLFKWLGALYVSFPQVAHGVRAARIFPFLSFDKRTALHIGEHVLFRTA
jgi:hypothetical protein